MCMLTAMDESTKRKSYLPHEYICESCAHAEGCTWPDGHCATFNCEFPCGYCGKKKAFDEGGVCATSDWNFPHTNIPTGDLSPREL